jgi:hypothetical protein
VQVAVGGREVGLMEGQPSALAPWFELSLPLESWAGRKGAVELRKSFALQAEDGPLGLSVSREHGVGRTS